MAKEINELTKEQESKIQEYYDRYMKIGTCTDPCPREDAERAIKAAYKYMKLKEPTYFLWVNSPYEGAKIASYLCRDTSLSLSQPDVEMFLASDKSEITKEQIKDMISKASYGSFEAFWVSFYSFIAYELPVEKDELIDIINDIVKTCGVYWTFENVVVISERPAVVNIKDSKLHNTVGPSLVFRDGEQVFATDGIRHNNLMEMVIKSQMEKPSEATR